jgi:CheY-like chemotaxis protein
MSGVGVVLIVEDNAITRRTIADALTASGLAVVEAADAATALSELAAQPAIALVLLDLMLPDRDGFALAGELRAVRAGGELPILAVTGLIAKDDEARLASAGFDGIVAKPVDPVRLVHSVRAHLPFGEERPTSARLRLVLADDDITQRKLVAYRLQKVGYDVVLAGDGDEALARIREVRPDAVVSDVLMPKLDGFGLCMAMRADPDLAAIPVLLITNSYVEAADHQLASRVGASDLIVRTPELAEVFAALTRLRAPELALSASELERERGHRVMSQLERQLVLNATSHQRNTLLAAELAVLTAISKAVADHDDLEGALRQAIAACFDAGGIAAGALYLTDDDGRRVLGLAHDAGELAQFFGHPELLERTIQSQLVLAVPSGAVAPETARHLLDRARASHLFLAPLGHRNIPLGALLVISRSPTLHAEDQIAFALAVASQISVALVLARAFTDKAASEQLALRQAEVLRSVLDSMSEGVIVSDERGSITTWNGAASAILPLATTPDERWRGVFASDRTTPITRDQLPLVRAQRGELIEGLELFVQNPQVPTGRYVNVSSRPLSARGHETGGSVVVFRDVTTERTAQTQLMVSDRMASLGTLAAGVGHEINNPLAALIGNLDLATSDLERVSGQLQPADAAGLREVLRDASEAAARVRQIAKDLKVFSHLADDEPAPVSIERVLDAACRMAWTEIRQRAKLVKSYDAVPEVLANEARLGQVFLNLVVNAAQAIAEGNATTNEIRIATRVDTGRVRIDITDTGHGMSEETRARLFTPFFTTKPAGVGTGLGLAICQRLIAAAGGTIEVASTLGRGTTFSVFLPPAIATTASIPIPIPAPPAVTRRRGRILAIDDDPIILAVVRRALGRDHEVTACDDGRLALQQIGDGNRYDVILCDLMMPALTGMELHAELARLAPDQARAMLFVTGGAFTANAGEFLAAVDNARLEKPFDVRELRTLIDGIVARRAL